MTSASCVLNNTNFHENHCAGHKFIPCTMLYYASKLNLENSIRNAKRRQEKTGQRRPARKGRTA